MYKILIRTYKCIHRLVPLYLQELILEYKPTCNLPSVSKLNLITATVSTLTYGHRSFHKASAELWNNLPKHVKNCRTVSQFKSSLKSHLFKAAYFWWLSLIVVNYCCIHVSLIFGFNVSVHCYCNCYCNCNSNYYYYYFQLFRLCQKFKRMSY